jgi:hypothetical protein
MTFSIYTHEIALPVSPDNILRITYERLILEISHLVDG